MYRSIYTNGPITHQLSFGGSVRLTITNLIILLLIIVIIIVILLNLLWTIISNYCYRLFKTKSIYIYILTRPHQIKYNSPMCANNMKIPIKKYNCLILDDTHSHSRYYPTRYIVHNNKHDFIKHTLSRFEFPSVY